MGKTSIALDGPAGAGKSTLAKRLASFLGYLYVDTGAIYRTVGLFVEKEGKDCKKAEDVIACLPKIQLKLTHGADGLQHMLLGEEDVSAEIRENRVSAYASQVSAIPEVRSFLLDMQRNLALNHDVVMDGRDIGTVVLPNATVKIFITASPEVRAKRRHLELSAKGDATAFETVLSEIIARDLADSQREIAPLIKAKDATLCDTSDLNLDESLSALVGIVKEKLGQ